MSSTATPLRQPYTLPTTSLTFPNRVLNAAGCWCTTQADLDDLFHSASGGVVSKSCTEHAREGNVQPRLYTRVATPTTFSINSTGLANLGIAFYNAYTPPPPQAQQAQQQTPRKPYIVSVAGVEYGENVRLVRTLQTSAHTSHVDAIELNLSCPNVAGKPQVGYDFDTTHDVLQKVFDVRAHVAHVHNNTPLPLGLKLPPYLDQSHFKRIAEVLGAFRTDVAFVTCINSLGNGFVFADEVDDDGSYQQAIAPNGGFGGIGGAGLKPFGLANVRALRRELPMLPLVGCGGVATTRDALEYLAVGASLVQVGTALVGGGLGVFGRVLG